MRTRSRTQRRPNREGRRQDGFEVRAATLFQLRAAVRRRCGLARDCRLVVTDYRTGRALATPGAERVPRRTSRVDVAIGALAQGGMESGDGEEPPAAPQRGRGWEERLQDVAADVASARGDCTAAAIAAFAQGDSDATQGDGCAGWPAGSARVHPI